MKQHICCQGPTSLSALLNSGLRSCAFSVSLHWLGTLNLSQGLGAGYVSGGDPGSWSEGVGSPRPKGKNSRVHMCGHVCVFISMTERSPRGRLGLDPRVPSGETRRLCWPWEGGKAGGQSFHQPVSHGGAHVSSLSPFPPEEPQGQRGRALEVGAASMHERWPPPSPSPPPPMRAEPRGLQGTSSPEVVLAGPNQVGVYFRRGMGPPTPFPQPAPPRASFSSIPHLETSHCRKCVCIPQTSYVETYPLTCWC